MDAEKIILDDGVQGLGYIGDPVDGSITVSSFTFGAGATNTFETNTLAPSGAEEAMTISNVRFSGVGNSHVNNKWAYVTGQFFFRNIGPPSYDIIVVIERTGSGLRIRVQFYNPTGANMTVPNITVSIKSYYYAPSW